VTEALQSALAKGSGALGLSAANRLKEIRLAEGQIMDTFKEWPRLTDPREYTLVRENLFIILNSNVQKKYLV
jgi:hypothetical protein